MFILRRINENGVEYNEEIGDTYKVVEQKTSPVKFEMYMDDNGCNPDLGIYAFVITSDRLIPLYDNQKIYVMTETGQTFDNLTFK